MFGTIVFPNVSPFSGETDWKILAIDVTDPLAEVLHDIADIEANMPGLLEVSKRAGKVKVEDAHSYQQAKFESLILYSLNSTYRGFSSS